MKKEIEAKKLREEEEERERKRKEEEETRERERLRKEAEEKAAEEERLRKEKEAEEEKRRFEEEEERMRKEEEEKLRLDAKLPRLLPGRCTTKVPPMGPSSGIFLSESSSGPLVELRSTWYVWVVETLMPVTVGRGVCKTCQHPSCATRCCHAL